VSPNRGDPKAIKIDPTFFIELLILAKYLPH